MRTHVKRFGTITSGDYRKITRMAGLRYNTSGQRKNTFKSLPRRERSSGMGVRFATVSPEEVFD